MKSADARCWWRLWMKGVACHEDKLELIFDRFQQVDASDSRQKGGTGTGACDLPDDYGAAWRDASGQNEIRTVGRAFSSAWRRCHRAKEAVSGILPRHAHEEGVVLLCDDDESTRLVMKASLQQNGYEVVEAVRVGQRRWHMRRKWEWMRSCWT